MTPPLKGLRVEIAVPQGAVFRRMPGRCLLTFAGFMVQFVVPPKLSPPTLGLLVEQGREELLRALFKDGNSQSKAARLVREAEKRLETTGVTVAELALGECVGRRYTHTSSSNVPPVRHYAFQLGSHFVNVIASQMLAGAPLPELEQIIASLRVREGSP